MWTTFSKIIVIAVLANVSLGELICSDEEKAKAEANHQKCIQTVEARTDTGPGRLFDICRRLDEQIHKCGEHLSDCLSARDLRLVKDAQISAFTKFLDAQRLSHVYQDCDIVREYRASGRKPFKETDLCELEEVDQVMKERENCVKRETVIMKGKMRSASRFDASRHSDILCDFVDKAMHDCAKEIEKCYTSEEFQKFTEQSYIILSKVLVKFESDFHLDQCQDLATPVPLTDILSGSSKASSFNMILVILFGSLFSYLF